MNLVFHLTVFVSLLAVSHATLSQILEPILDTIEPILEPILDPIFGHRHERQHGPTKQGPTKQGPTRQGPTGPNCRRNNNVCPASYQPLCAAPISGSDGNLRTFSNPCWLQNFNCQNPNSRYEIAYNQPCSSNIPITLTCGSACGKIYKPVCTLPLSAGENDQTKQFSNICGLADFNCRHRDALYQIVYNGTCSSNIPIPSVCPSQCNDIYKPICAVPVKTDDDDDDDDNDISFSNICFLGNHNCKHRNDLYKSIYNGTCDDYYDHQDYSSSSSGSDENSSSSSDNSNKKHRRYDNDHDVDMVFFNFY